MPGPCSYKNYDRANALTSGSDRQNAVMRQFEARTSGTILIRTAITGGQEKQFNKNQVAGGQASGFLYLIWCTKQQALYFDQGGLVIMWNKFCMVVSGLFIIFVSYGTGAMVYGWLGSLGAIIVTVVIVGIFIFIMNSSTKEGFESGYMNGYYEGYDHGFEDCPNDAYNRDNRCMLAAKKHYSKFPSESAQAIFRYQGQEK